MTLTETQRAATSSHKTMQEVLFNTPAGSTLQYFKRGKGPIMIVTPPAWGLGTKYLAEAFEPLEQTFTLIYLELRANGKSSRPAASEMSCWHAADDIEHLRQELKLEKIPCLLGHSGGGTIALWYAIRYNKVDRLILLNHRLDGFDDSKSMKEAIVEKAKNPKMHAPLKAWTTSHENLTDEGFAQVIRSFLPIYFYNPDAFYRSKVLSNLQSVSLWNYQTVNGADRQVHQQEPELGKVTAKTLVVSCRADPVCTPAQAIATHKGIAGSKLVIYEKCGHFPWLETDEVFDDIIDFCNS
ncbi:Alpha/Beta hydrolase protein [Trichoderma longibrachiatum]|uniref:Alpha/beta-hydrolase n=1 Tax=Trichoderma longibrachiatum ATCC 18648 TaxID=983965 RepID=A0A2T4BWM9_TRILO|nr:alpha/beta-hydrolase [Trichoderma longibrachiatum ATCC 18648]